MYKKILISVCFVVLLALSASAQEKKEAATAATPAADRVAPAKETMTAINESIAALNGIDMQRRLEIERLKNLILAAQVILRLGPEWEFDLKVMEFRKKAEEKPAPKEK